ncbi:uncharacterized protein CTHT_0029200 [Thermochaetoides thermophila DSM 1495]|uniref:Nucleolar protein 16 n=1 Tax=Chaetomium thermophilum (strain DSM 1495 / CBS 144.50 / IMI 039719) TaxID=759272 RepID=G0S832_CHATD|nr:hypothetical protein CTHT_0029200 [Thermochaetoides thermophila DSM 1495]8I9P_CR Chain CR, Nucleolar protein 16 [Thermochaetoides thermophila DSM 1495]8I9R_CR Chain CR, Nucleolar protein 16 [Thermochaetoides thermophila DSM 1495]8I9T_CR Chain CR, Nucleolar protein 16 [Thermochaetoides thermophila DSM 1495]8I9V_CR Chain CR, Nucleolar protein 16 [Thermochaetoides thermophila DSM 1495]8I9W_CR Chain CR, Nucleolar protein 16 [Thermochaetoides thermophila DSM 1495]8I9X_CR Chain CR, Nucleolar pro
MGRELQKRKRRSSRPTIRMPNRRKKALNPAGNNIIAKSWNKKETLSQNYTRFGLVAKLGKATGGTAPGNKALLKDLNDPLAIKSGDQGLIKVSEVKVERDEQGRIKRVVRDNNPLNDPLNDLDSDSESDAVPQQQQQEQPVLNNHIRQHDLELENVAADVDDESKPEVLRALEREATRPVEKTVRHQSEREREWLQRLVDKHGDDVAAMARDRKLNPYQQTASDIKRRLKKAGLLSA